MHFWLSTARLYGRVPNPRNTSLNWFMPALVNNSVGSSCGTTGDDGTIVCCFDRKRSRNCWRISFAVGMENLKNVNHRVTESTEKTKPDLCLVCALCDSVVNPSSAWLCRL